MGARTPTQEILMTAIPHKVTNFQCYGGLGGLVLFGTTDVELPSFEALTETISGAGIAGEIDSPVPGHFGSMSVKLKWRTVTAQALGLLAQVEHGIVLMGSVQVQESTSGALASVALRVEVRGPIKMMGLGKLEPGKLMDTETEIEVSVIRVSMAGVPIVELDKLNMRFVVNGVDYLATVRADTGGV
jgi:P2 family phage contractile tail tube protein